MRYVPTPRTANHNEDWFSTAELAYLTGITYRRLDYMAREMGFTTGSGRPRRWPPGSWHRLLIALALDPGPARQDWHSHFQAVAHAVFAAPPPPANGWATYHDGIVTYSATPALALYDVDAAVIARIPGVPEDALFGQLRPAS